MTDLSFAIPRAPYKTRSSSLAATGGPIPSKGSVASIRENVSAATAVNSFASAGSAEKAPFRYSTVVRSRFYWAAVLFLAGSSLSAFALVQGSQKLGIASAFVFAASSFYAFGWLERADRERHKALLSEARTELDAVKDALNLISNGGPALNGPLESSQDAEPSGQVASGEPLKYPRFA